MCRFSTDGTYWQHYQYSLPNQLCMQMYWLPTGHTYREKNKNKLTNNDDNGADSKKNENGLQPLLFIVIHWNSIIPCDINQMSV